jgi:D-amino-acid dehydrogenase
MRGQIIHLSLPGTNTREWPIVHAFHGHYLVAWHDSRVAVGATRETEAGFNPQPTAAGVREVLDEALRVAPGLSDAVIKEIRVGLRPACTDGLPVIGPVRTVDNVYVATGFAAIGLQLGPYCGKLAAQWALAETSPIDIAPFSIARFSA